MNELGETAAVAAARARYLGAVREAAALPEVRSLAHARVCVAGFTGQVGSALVRVLAEANRTTLAAAPMRITGVARRPRQAEEEDVEAIYADVASGDLPLREFTHVFYAVGVTSDYRSRPEEVLATQLVGLESFLKGVAPQCTVVFVSSARVYGRHATDAELSEDSPAKVTPMHLDNLYDSTKRLAESLCLWHSQRPGPKVTVVRPGNVYGLDSRGSTTSVSELVREAASRARITLTGAPTSLRNYCCAVDLAQGILRAASRGRSGHAYNIGSEEHLTTEELARAIADCFDSEIEIAVAAGPAPPSYQRLSLRTAAEELGYAPRLRIRDVMPAVVAEVSAELAARDIPLRARPG